MEEEKLRAVYYARCSTEEENQKDALVRQAAEAEEKSLETLTRTITETSEQQVSWETIPPVRAGRADGNITACTRISSRTGLMSS